MIKIEIQHFEGCPNGPAMIENVKQAVEDLENKMEIEYKETLVEDAGTALKLGFRGSPTLLINGVDFEGIPEPNNPGLTCRFYKNGVPAVGEIEKRLISLSK